MNNAAIAHKAHEPLSVESAQELFATNCRGALDLSRRMLPLMAPSSRIVMVSTRSAEIARFGSKLRPRVDRASGSDAALNDFVQLYLDHVKDLSESEGAISCCYQKKSWKNDIR